MKTIKIKKTIAKIITTKKTKKTTKTTKTTTITTIPCDTMFVSLNSMRKLNVL